MFNAFHRWIRACVWLCSAASGGALGASFDPGSAQLSMPRVIVDAAATYTTVVIRLNSFGALAVDDPAVGSAVEYHSGSNRLLLPSVTVGSTTYRRVSLTGASFDLVGVGARVATVDAGAPVAPVSSASLAGTKDTGFGTFGYRNTTAPARAILKAVPLPERRQIYLFGSHGTAGILGRSIVRLTEDGAVDATYGTNGVYERSDPTLELNIRAFAVDSSGRAYVVSWPNGSDGPQGAQVTRLDATGQPDTTFGAAGSVTLNSAQPAGHPYSHIRVATTLADDSLLLAGYAATTREGTTRSWVIWKLLPGGQLDTRFGNQGVAAIPTGAADEPSVLTVARSGDIYLSGRRGDTDKTWVVARFDADGVPDAAYGSGGFASVGTGTARAVHDLRVDSAGGLLVVGHATGTTNRQQAWVTRLQPTGRVDADFGTQGQTFVNYYNQPTPVGSDTFADTATRVWFDGSGRILVGGYALDKSFNGTSTAYSTVTRLLPGGQIDPSFFGGVPNALAQAANYGFISRFPATNIWEGEVRPVLPAADGSSVLGVLMQANTTVYSVVRWR